MSKIVPPFHIMAKPVCGMCNLDCEYCYYTSKPRQLYGGTAEFMMSDEVLEQYTREYLPAAPAQAELGWQGGEPLLAGKRFFRKALELQRRYCRAGQKVVNAVQTNGTLIDDEWAELFAENGFLVGLSLDGPPQWHDHFRRDRAGGETFHRAWAGLELLRKHNVQLNVLVTLNARNAPHGGDVYRYFVNRGVHWLQFIPILEKDDAGRPREFSCTARQFGQFMLDVLGLWLDKHVGVVSVRLIDSVLNSIVHGEASLCCNARRCANAYVLEWNGDLYACDHFVRREWLIGNIMTTPLMDLLRSPRLDEFAALKTDLPAACRECEFLRYCNAGCPKHHIPEAASGDPKRLNHFCQGYKMFFQEGLPELEIVAASLKSGRQPQPRTRRQSDASDSRSDQPVGAAGRNDPCPCGSGRKHKHCCGRT